MTYLAVGAVMLVLILLLLQRRMIYFPRSYGVDDGGPAYAQLLPPGTSAFDYASADGTMVGFFHPGRGQDPTRAPERLWLCMGGNGGLALEWPDIAGAYPDASLVLLDYPGYGACAGAPTRASIAAAVDAAIAALAARWSLSPDQLWPRVALLGHSLGCAAGLDAATRHPVRGAVLVAPFTALLDMARNQMGWPLCVLLKDRFDNRAALRVLLARTPPPPLTIIHGTADAVIPFAMGKELAALDPSITFVPVVDGDHNEIVYQSQDAIVAAMKRVDGR